MKKFISLFLVFSLIITPFEGVLALSSSSTSVKDRINTFRSGSDLPIIDISESKSSKVRSEKTSNAYLPTVKSKGFSLHYHIGRNMMIRKGESSTETTLTYFNEKKQPSVQVDPIFATFYTYDSQGRLTEKTKVDSLDAIWDPSTQIFKKPQILNSKATRVKWDYTTSTSHQIRLRQEFIGNSTHPSKVVTYRYLSDDLRLINSFDGNKFKFLNELSHRRSAIQEKLPDKDIAQLVDKKLSSITVSNGKENHFYYNPNLTLAFIEHKEGESSKNILMPLADLDYINDLYSEIDFEVQITSTDSSGAAFYIDSHGNVWDSKKKVSFGDFSWSDGLYVNAAAAGQVFAPYLAGAGATSLADGPLPVGEVIGLGIIIIGAGAATYTYFTAPVANSVEAASNPSMDLPAPHLNPNDLSKIGTGVIGAAFAFESLSQVKTVVDYWVDSIEIPNNNPKTLYRGYSVRHDLSGVPLSEDEHYDVANTANMVKAIEVGTRIIYKDVTPAERERFWAYFFGTLEDMMKRHKDGSYLSPFVSLTSDWNEAVKWGTDKGEKDGYVYVFVLPSPPVIKNNYNVLEAEWLFPIKIPKIFMIERIPVSKGDYKFN